MVDGYKGREYFMRAIVVVLLLLGLVSLGMYIEQRPSSRTQIISERTDGLHTKSVQLASERQGKLFLMAQLRAMHEFIPLVAQLKRSEIDPKQRKELFTKIRSANQRLKLYFQGLKGKDDNLQDYFDFQTSLFNLEEKIDEKKVKLSSFVTDSSSQRLREPQDIRQISNLLTGLDRLQDKKIAVDKKYAQELAPGDLKDFYLIELIADLQQRKEEELSRLGQQQFNQRPKVASEAMLKQAMTELDQLPIRNTSLLAYKNKYRQWLKKKLLLIQSSSHHLSTRRLSKRSKILEKQINALQDQLVKEKVAWMNQLSKVEEVKENSQQ